MQVGEGLKLQVQLSVEGFCILLAVVFEQSHGEFVCLMVAPASVSFNGALKLYSLTFERHYLECVVANHQVAPEILRHEVFRQLVLPVDVHLVQIIQMEQLFFERKNPLETMRNTLFRNAVRYIVNP